MDKFAESLSNKEYFEKQLSSTLLYQVLFPKMDWFHQQSSWQEEFYLVKNSFSTQCSFDINFNHLNVQEIKTDIKGEILDKVSLQDLLRGKKFNEESEEPVVVLLELKYTTDKVIKQMIKAEAGNALFHEGDLYRKQKVLLSKMEDHGRFR